MASGCCWGIPGDMHWSQQESGVPLNLLVHSLELSHEHALGHPLTQMERHNLYCIFNVAAGVRQDMDAEMFQWEIQFLRATAYML